MNGYWTRESLEREFSKAEIEKFVKDFNCDFFVEEFYKKYEGTHYYPELKVCSELVEEGKDVDIKFLKEKHKVDGIRIIRFRRGENGGIRFVGEKIKYISRFEIMDI